MQFSEREGYFYREVASSYAGIEQRWLVVLYEPRREQELAQLQKRIGREADKLAKGLKKLQREAFNCEEDAQKALEDFAKQWSFHRVTGDVYDVTRFTQRGRPKADSPTITEWKIEAEFEPDEEAITQQEQFLGKYLRFCCKKFEKNICGYRKSNRVILGLSGQAKEPGNDLILCSDVILFSLLDLSLSYHVHRFVTL